MSPDPRHIRLKVPMVTRLEGEGALELYAHDNQLEHVQLRIYDRITSYNVCYTKLLR